MGKSFSYEDAVGQTASNGAFSYEDAINETPKPQNKGIIGDTVTDLKRGVEQLPGALTGLTDLVNPLTYLTGTRMADTAANWLGEKTGFQPSKWQEEAASEYSPERKASDEAISKAWEEGGAANIAGAIATNPRSILGVVGQSAPSMIAGGGAARLAMKGLASIGGTELAALTKAAQVEGAAGNAARETLNRMATTAGAIGEGAVTAGQNMDQVSRDVDPAKAAATSLAAGVITGGIGKVSGRVANKLGLPDVETAMAGGGLQKSGLPWYKRIPSAAAQEGLLQEFPQSAQEQIWQNLAEDKPWYEGALRQGVEGALAGGGIGGGSGLLAGRQESNPTEQPEPTTIAGLLPAPTSTGTPSEQVLQAEVARQNAVDAAQANADRIYAERDLYEETMKSVFPYGVPTITEPVAPIQQRIDELLGVDQTKLKGLQRDQYQRELKKAYDEPVGITHDADGREIPLTMGDLLNSQATVEITLREKRQQAIDNAAAQALARNDQVASEETAQQPEPIPVVGPLSAIANQAVKTGVAAQVQAQKAAAENPNGELTQNTADAQVATPSAPTQGSDVPGGGSILEPASTGVADSSGNSSEVAQPSLRADVATGGASQESLITQPQGTGNVEQTTAAPKAQQAETQGPQQQPAAAVRGYPQGQARMLAGRMTKQGFPSEIYPHPTMPGMFAIGIAGENNAESTPAGAPNTTQEKPNGQETASPAPALTAPVAPQRTIPPNQRRDDLVGAILRVTGGAGVASSMADTIVGEKANKVGKLRGLFTNAGQQDLDDLAMLLREEEGYDVRDGSHLEELIRAAASGDVPKSMARQEADAEAAKEKRYRDEIRAKAKKYGIKTVAVKFSELEQRVFETLEQRHKKALELLDTQSQERFNAALEAATATIPEEVVDETLAEVSRRGLHARDFWNEATRILRGMIYDATQETSNAEQPTENGNAQGDGRGDQGTGRGIAADQGDQAQPGQAETEEVAPTLELAGQTPAEVRAQEAKRKADEEAAKREEKPKTPNVTVDQVDLFNTQGGLFDGKQAAPIVPEPADRTQAKVEIKSLEPFEIDLGSMFGKMKYRPQNIPDIPDGHALVDSSVVVRKTAIRKSDSESYNLPRTVFAWRVSSVLNRDGSPYSMIEAMTSDFGRTENGEVKAYFTKLDSHAADALGRIAPSVESKAVQMFQMVSRGQRSMFSEPQESADLPRVDTASAPVASTEQAQPSIVAPTTNVQRTLPDRIAAAKQKKADENAERAAKFAELRAKRKAEKEAAPNPSKSAESKPDQENAVAVDESVLTDMQLLRKWGDKWQYKFVIGSNWMTANTKEDAVERATKTYYKTPVEERLTSAQRFDKANADEFAQMSQRYGNLSLAELRAKYDELGGDIESLQRSGAREMNGNGGRRTSAAVSAQGARETAEERMRLGRYIEARESAEPNSAPVVEKSQPAMVPEWDSFADFWNGMLDGKASITDLKEAFGTLTERADEFKASIAKLKNDQLKRMLGWSARPDDKKADLVSKVYEQTLARFTLNKPAPSEQWVYGEKMEVVKKRYLDQLRSVVDGLTDADLKQFVDSIAESNKAKKAALEEKKAAVADPKTLEDFNLYATYNKNTGKTPAEARKALTPEQRATWDSLAAEKSRTERLSRAGAQKTEVSVAAVTTEGQIIETKHTKTGQDLFVVKAAERVDRDVYNQWNATAKRLGGWYSSFRGNGAVPGFQFKTREGADAFLKFLGGDVEQAKEVVQERRDAYADDRSQSAVERLNEMADRLEESALEDLGRERKVNTNRRAGMAARAEAAARSQEALAKTMRNIAKAIESGAAKMLDKVRQKTQVEMLREFVRNAKDSEARAQDPNNWYTKELYKQPPTAETAEFAQWPTYSADRSDLANLARRMIETDGTRKLGQQLLKIADDVTDVYKKFAKENLHKVSVFSASREGSSEKTQAVFPTAEAAERAIARSGFKGKATTISFKRGEHLVIMGPTMAKEAGIWDGDDSKRITLDPDSGSALVEALGRKRGAPEVPWQFQNTYDKRKKLAAMGIETPAEFRTALREFIGLREAPKEADKVKELERAMVGRKNDGLDFFPTPAGTAQEMIDAAEIAEGMSVLEPSAGMGHIAEQIRDVAGIEPDVIEFNGDRRELLEAKGFNVVGSDFMEADGRYDRIIMNPPFSDRRDAQHVQHAYSLLKPGGRLVSIMGEGVFFGQDKKAQAFRSWLEEVGGTSERLPEGSFLDPSLPVNTGVNARMVVIDKPAGQVAPVENEGAGNQANDGRISPSDKAVYGMAAEGKSATEILKFIQASSRNPFYRQLAKLLQQTGINPTITVGDSKGWKFNAGDGKYSAAYNPATDTAALFRPAAAERNVLHELMHAATLKALAKKGMAAAQMRALFEHVKKSGKLRGQYGMSNVDEFVAEAFTNPKFQQALKKVKAPQGGTLQSAWHWFVRVVRGILGLKQGDESALSAALELGVGVMRENMGLANAGGDVRYASETGKVSQIDTPAFAKWFGDSKVVDAEGKPMIVYHGTRSNFDTFDLEAKANGGFWPSGALGSFFSPKDWAAEIYGPNVKPVYLAMQNPYRMSTAENGSFTTREQARAKRADLVAQGYDGIIIGEQQEFVAFHPEQIKSAIGNNGDFDPSNPDIRYNVADDGAWTVSAPSKMDDVIYSLQDKHIDTKRVIESIRATGKKIIDEFNPYLQEELFHGRAAKGVKDFLDMELRPLLAQMQAAKIDMGDFEEYLWNRHAEERNRQIAKINPEMKDGGSGIKTADAQAYLSGLPADRRATFEKLAARVDSINRSSQEILVSSGLEKAETIAAWNGVYKHYVPLQREDVDSGHVGTGKGFSIRGSSSKRAMGSGRAVVDIIANITMQRERNIVRAEKNRVSNALLGLAIDQPNADFWTVDTAPKERVVNQKAIYTVLDADGKKIDEFTRMDDAQKLVAKNEGATIDQTWGDRVEERVIPGFSTRDNVVMTRINGEDHYVIFNERDERAMRMSAALKNLDADQMGRVLSVVGKATRYLASVNTQYNPVFGVINLIRDAQGALLNLSSTPLAGEQKKVMAYTVDALRGIYADIRARRAGKVPSSKWAELFEEFQNEGGQTGYRDQYANAADRAEAIRDELNQFAEGSPRKLLRGVFGWLSDYNETMENAVRLASYKAGVEKGMSKQQAASLAKSITVNFNRKGQAATQIGALYAFFNASVQGTARIGQTLFDMDNGDYKTIRLSKTGKKIVYGGILLGSMQAMLLAAAGFDDDEPPDFVRERNLILPIGDGKYLTLAMPLGFHVLPGIGRIATEFALSGFKDPTKRIFSLLGMFTETFNPIGSAGFSLQTITPSVVDPIAALAENRDFSGKEIARENMNPMNPKPGHLRTKDTATYWSKLMSSGINFITGGTEFQPGMLSPTPDQLDYLIGQATGGVGREVNKVAQTVSSGWSGEDLPLYKVPLAGRFIGDTSGQSGESAKFYASIKRINGHEAEVKGLREQKRSAEAAEYIAENPESKLIMPANFTERTVQKLRAQKRELLKAGAEADRIRKIDTQITETMTRFNQRVAALSG